MKLETNKLRINTSGEEHEANSGMKYKRKEEKERISNLRVNSVAIKQCDQGGHGEASN
jgi:hypothetical protein